MKWMMLFFLLGVFAYCVMWAGVTHRAEMISDPRVEFTNFFPGTVRLSSNTHSEQMNMLITKNLLSRFPKNYPYVVRDFEPFTNLHGLILQDDCFVILTSFKTKDQREAVQTAFPYYQAYIDTMNNTREIRPYLYEFPVSMTKYTFALGFADDPNTRQSYPAPYFASVLLMKLHSSAVQVMQYSESAPRNERFSDVYDNCLGALPEGLQAMNVPRLEKTDKEKPIVISQADKFFGPTDSCKDEFLFATHFAKENNLKLIAFMSAFDFWKPINRTLCCALNYATQESFLSIEQVRDLLFKMRNEHVSFFQKDGWLVNRVNEARERGEEVLSSTIDAQQYLAFRVSFWDKYIDRVKAPYIAEVQVYGKKARYYVADELQRLQLVLEEELPNYDVEVPCSAEPKSKKEKS